MKSLEEYIIENYDEFDDLCKRLQEDYNGGIPFEQSEEDRLIIYDLLEIIDFIKKEKERKEKMEKIIITANARNLILGASENIITIAEDIKRVIVTENGVSHPEIELTNWKDYTKEEALKIIDKNMIAKKWNNTIENGKEHLVIVLENKK